MNYLQTDNAGPDIGKTRLEIYTDGSCLGNPGPGGWGLVAMQVTESGNNVIRTWERSEHGRYVTSNNRAELEAAIAALQFALEEQPGVPVTIVTDSQYLSKGITEWLPVWKARGWQTSSKKPVKNKDLWQRLEGLVQELNVQWRWVKAHTGQQFNERADALAKAAAERAQKVGCELRPAA